MTRLIALLGLGLLLGVVAIDAPTPGAASQDCVATEAEPMPPPPAGVIIDRYFNPLANRAREAELIVVGTAVALGPTVIDEARSDAVG